MQKLIVGHQSGKGQPIEHYLTEISPPRSHILKADNSQMKAYSTQPLMRIISRPLRACSVPFVCFLGDVGVGK